MRLTAYEVVDPGDWTLEPSPAKRDWMAAHRNFAYRCLPLTIANQAGWAIGSPVTFTAVWNGRMEKGAVAFQFEDAYGSYARQITDHFGAGIVTFNVPWLFRTDSPGVGLSVRGLPNAPKFNATPLEGFVETDWLPFTFTMNWKLVRPGVPVTFVKGEPICFIHPHSILPLESIAAVRRPLADDPEALQAYRQWEGSRESFNADPRRDPAEWQKFYHAGSMAPAPPTHRTAIKAPPFERSATG